MSDKQLARRTFLQSVSAAGVVGVTGLAPAGLAHAGLDAGPLSADRFETLVQQQLSVRSASGNGTRLQLVSVDRPARRSEAVRRSLAAAPVRREPFSVLFRADSETALSDGIHQLEHARLGRHQLFLSRVMSPEGESGVFFELHIG